MIKVQQTDVGYAPGTVQRFLEEMKMHDVNLHSLLLLRHGQVFCEEYAPEFDENFRHRLYSVSKSYVSAAVGVAIGEGFLSLESKLVDYFPDKLPQSVHPYIQNMTVEDCLKMATPYDDTPYHHLHRDWVEDFFHAEATHRAGSLFHYDTGATLVLDALVERVTGKPFNEYLYDKVLQYIGYTQVPPCVEAPDGTKWGGSGMLCTTREFARFALLFANGGKDEKGIERIPSWYVEKATQKQIGNMENNKHTKYYGHGYGYQLWRLQFGWAMLGMGNQLAFYCPEADVLLVCTADDQGNDYARYVIIEAMDRLLLQPFCKALPQQETGLSFPKVPGEVYSDWQEKIGGKTFVMEPNKNGIQRVRFDFEGETGKMVFWARGEEKCILFGLKCFVQGEFPEKEYSGIRINTPYQKGYRCFTQGAWDLPDLLVLRCYVSDIYFGVLTVNVRFCQQGIDIKMTKTAEWFLEEYVGFMTGRLS